VNALAQMKESASAGRICPQDYAYAPSVLARAPDFETKTFYVVGGLYGNAAALAAIKAMAAAENAELVFNGDFHWFDADPDWFAEIEHGVAPYRALRGNVETEIARTADIGVAAATVSRAAARTACARCQGQPRSANNAKPSTTSGSA